MKNAKSLLLAVLLVGFTSSAAMAEEGKVYAAVDYGQGRAQDACTGLPSSISCSSTVSAYRFGMGYQANQNAGVEAAYLSTGKITASGTYLAAPANYDASMSGFQFAAIGTYPISSELALLGKAGIAMITGKSTLTLFGVTTSSDQSNTNFTFGFGARFKANDKIEIRLMYEDLGTIKTYSASSGSKVTLLSAGLQVGF
jgi:opacity protein-like surface antigen